MSKDGWDLSRPYRVFVDESEVRGYSITAVYLRPSDVHRIRKALRCRLRSGQRSIHFTKERDDVRRAVIHDIVAMPVKVEVYRSAAKPRIARPRCLRALAEALRDGGCQQLVLDRNDAAVQSDRRVLHEAFGSGWDGTYDHLHDHEEPLLWLADAVSWCWNKGGQWREALAGVTLDVIELGD
ncbi:hypothetical protein [Actinomyces ruminicola]|uniref:hypothetical protein n=1 Tax=Actinomyces ruminicola TaxID=332524 RepID=UPI00115FA470|nr:hypothetical protein [Actinomyces ruminicola]